MPSSLRYLANEELENSRVRHRVHHEIEMAVLRTRDTAVRVDRRFVSVAVPTRHVWKRIESDRRART